jgi:methanogenic corrinoid protein MtbC1
MNQPSSAQLTERAQDTNGVTGLGEQQFMTMLTKEVIPRLVLLEEETAQFGSPPVNIGGPAVSRLQAAALALSDLAVEKDLRHCQNAIAALVREGYAVEQILLEVVQPAARLLGQRWNEDSCNFADVTLGMWNIQQVFTDLAVTMRHTASGFVIPDQLAPSVLFCTLPNCHHRLGVQMVSAFFLRAGWNTQLAQGRSETELLNQIAGFAPDLLGLSVSSEADILRAADFIRRVRGLQSPQKNGPITLGIMLGGPATTVFPELARQAGADLLAGDAPEALAAAESFIKKDADRGPR